MNYSVGDLISFSIKRRGDQERTDSLVRWSSCARIIGFDGDKVVWCLCEGVPYAVALDKIRPATPAESLAYLHLRQTDETTLPFFPRPTQENYVDAADVVIQSSNDEDEDEAPDLVDSSDSEDEADQEVDHLHPSVSCNFYT